MAATDTGSGGGRFAMFRSTFFLKTIGVAIALFALGYALPELLPDNEFTGVLVGMSWSLAALILLVLGVAVVGTILRRALAPVWASVRESIGVAVADVRTRIERIRE